MRAVLRVCAALMLLCARALASAKGVQPEATTPGRSVLQTDPVRQVTSKYFNNDELEAHLKNFQKRCSKLSRLFIVGSSAQGSPLYALEMSSSPGARDPKPNVKYISNMHGNEPTGRVLLLALAEWLCANYDSDDRAKKLMDGLHLYLMPSMNPDGFAANRRENSAGVDLNRDFPDRLRSESMVPTGREQPETMALINWLKDTKFVASAGMHEGAMVANYPWDGTADRSTKYEACPDDATFQHLARTYAQSHKTMALPTNTEFPDGGTTNGAAWYPIWGGMQVGG